MKVSICIPCHDRMHANCGISLAQLCLRSHAVIHDVAVASGTYLPPIRNSLAMAALANKEITHILWIDSDMGFPGDALERLSAHDRGIVGINYARRLVPSCPTAMKDGKAYYRGKGLEHVDHVGFGLLLMDVGVFLDLERPYFHFEQAGDTYTGEDVLFCRMMKAIGIPVYVDNDLSQQVLHGGYPLPQQPTGGRYG